VVSTRGIENLRSYVITLVAIPLNRKKQKQMSKKQIIKRTQKWKKKYCEEKEKLHGISFHTRKSIILKIPFTIEIPKGSSSYFSSSRIDWNVMNLFLRNK
jgi:hypothetical protein